MRRSKSSSVTPQSSGPSPSPTLRRSTRKRGLGAEENVAAAAQPLTPLELRRSKRTRSSLQDQTSIFETPPPTSKKQSRRKVVTNKPVLTKNSGPPPTLMSLPYEVQLKLLSYLDVSSLESLAATSSQFDLLIHGRYLTSLAIPFDQSFLREIAATNTLEKKPLLRLQCTKPWGEGEFGRFAEQGLGVGEYVLHSQMALLQLDQVREIQLVPKDISPEHLTGHSMLDSFQAFDKIIMRQMSRLDILRNLSRLEIMIVDEDFSQAVLKEFMPKLTSLLELKVTIMERKAR